jgi:hypothetical protein
LIQELPHSARIPALWEKGVLRLVRAYARRIGLAALALCALVVRAEAQEYCVACTGPSAMYRCIIEGARPGGTQPLQTLCVTAMAKEGPHTACSVKGGTVFDCTGPVKRVPWAAYNDPDKKGAAPAAPAPQASQPQAPRSDPSQPPRTVEEMAKRANQKTAEQLKQANEDAKDQMDTLGDKIGDTTKKTWRCISSLFTRCTE